MVSISTLNMLHLKPALGGKALEGGAMSTLGRQRIKPPPISPETLGAKQALTAPLHRGLCQMSAAHWPGWKTRTWKHLERMQLIRARTEAHDGTVSAHTAA